MDRDEKVKCLIIIILYLNIERVCMYVKNVYEVFY